VRSAGTASWSIQVNEWDFQLEWALWVRAAERIELRAEGLVTGPPDVEPLPEPSVISDDKLAEGWLWWWRTLLAEPPDLGARAGFHPPDFAGLAGHPALRRVVGARWSEAHAWHSARKRAGVEALRTAHRMPDREGAAVRAVEAEIGRKAEPFSLRIIVLPVQDERIRAAGESRFLVPERVRASDAYESWLRDVVRAHA
jgi:hypothetical protein